MSTPANTLTRRELAAASRQERALATIYGRDGLIPFAPRKCIMPRLNTVQSRGASGISALKVMPELQAIYTLANTAEVRRKSIAHDAAKRKPGFKETEETIANEACAKWGFTFTVAHEWLYGSRGVAQLKQWSQGKLVRLMTDAAHTGDVSKLRRIADVLELLAQGPCRPHDPLRRLLVKLRWEKETPTTAAEKLEHALTFGGAPKEKPAQTLKQIQEFITPFYSDKVNEKVPDLETIRRVCGEVGYAYAQEKRGAKPGQTHKPPLPHKSGSHRPRN